MVLPLHTAACAGDGDTIEMIVSSRADMNVRTSDGDTAVMLAVRMGQCAAVDQLAQGGADINIHRESDGSTALHLACLHGTYQAVIVLLSSGADINALSTDGMTPLMVSVLKQNSGITQILVDRGADVNSGAFGTTPLVHAALRGNHEGARILLEGGANIFMDDSTTVLHFLMTKDEVDVDMVKIFLDAEVGMDIHREIDGCTPTHLACIEGHYAVVKALLSSNADMNALSRKGLTPMMYSVMVDNDAITQTLVDNGVDVNVVSNGHTALNLAAADGHHEGARILLKGGANISLGNMDGSSLLHLLVSKERVDVDMVKVLLDAGVDPLTRDASGRTPEDFLRQGETHDGARILLRRSATWRRRRLIVMLRSRLENSETGAAAKRVRVVTRSKKKLVVAVELLGMVPDGVFRLAVSFL